MEKPTNFETYTQAISYYLSIVLDSSRESEKPTAITRIGHCLIMIEKYGNNISIGTGILHRNRGHERAHGSEIATPHHHTRGNHSVTTGRNAPR